MLQNRNDFTCPPLSLRQCPDPGLIAPPNPGHRLMAIQLQIIIESILPSVSVLRPLWRHFPSQCVHTEMWELTWCCEASYEWRKRGFKRNWACSWKHELCAKPLFVDAHLCLGINSLLCMAIDVATYLLKICQRSDDTNQFIAIYIPLLISDFFILCFPLQIFWLHIYIDNGYWS